MTVRKYFSLISEFVFINHECGINFDRLICFTYFDCEFGDFINIIGFVRDIDFNFGWLKLGEECDFRELWEIDFLKKKDQVGVVSASEGDMADGQGLIFIEILERVDREGKFMILSEIYFLFFLF